MTIMEHRVSGDPQADPDRINPFEEFHGIWTTDLAEVYAEQFNHMFGKWECISGRLVVAPFEAADNSWAESTLIELLRPPGRKAGYFVMGCLNAGFDPSTWLQPDVSVLHKFPSPDKYSFVPIDHFTMPVEFVSRSSRRRDRVDKPAMLAEAGVPYYMLVEVDGRRRSVTMQQFKLEFGTYSVISSAITGGTFRMTEPFEVSFPVDSLLPPRNK